MGRHCSCSSCCSSCAHHHDCCNVKKINQALTLRVYMHCNNCEKKVAKALCSIEGVESFNMLKDGKVKVEGKFDFDKMMKALKRKSGRRVELLEAVKTSSTENATNQSSTHPDYTNDYFSDTNNYCTIQ